MRFHGFPRIILRLAPTRVAPLVALLVGAAVLLSPNRASAQSDVRDFILQNSSGFTIVSLQVAQEFMDVPWGPNILQAQLGPGQSARVNFFGGGPSVPCLYDIRVTTSDGQIGVDDADLCAVTTVTFPGRFTHVGNTQPSGSVQGAVAVPQAAPAQQAVAAPPAQARRSFALQNANSRWAVVEVNVADTMSSMNWGSNILAGSLNAGVVNPGQSTMVTFNPGNPSNCLYDIRVISSDGFEDVATNANLCQPYTFTFR